MPFFIEEEVETLLESEDISNKIEVEVKRYLTHVSKYNEVGYFFLKSILYVEDLIKSINKDLYGPDKEADERALSYHVKKLKIIKNCSELDESLGLLKAVRKYRNKIAHSLDYKPEEDPDFLKTFSISRDDDINEIKYKIAIHFKDIISGFLYIKIGIENIDTFIYFKK